MIDQKAQDDFYRNVWQSNIHLFKHSGKNLVDEINDLGPELVIDAGCGINFLKGKIKNLIGYDPVFKEADIVCGHWDAPFKTEVLVEARWQTLHERRTGWLQERPRTEMVPMGDKRDRPVCKTDGLHCRTC